jgi:hypothetical protein
MSYVDRSETKAYSAGTIVGLGGGYLLSRFIGAVAWVPAIVGGASFVLLKKVTKENTAVIATLAALIAQASWFLLGAILQPGRAPDVILDIVVDAVLIAAIYFRPGYVSATITIAWNAIGTAFIGYQLANAPEATGAALVSVEQRALVAHIILRLIIAGAAAMIMIYKANPDLLPDDVEDEEAMAE